MTHAVKIPPERPLSPAVRALIEATFDRLPPDMRRFLRFDGKDKARLAEAEDLSRAFDKTTCRLVRRLAVLRQTKASSSDMTGIESGPEERSLAAERDRIRRSGLSAFAVWHGN